MNRRMRAQSAMEYLMTYGWAILIIAVVLGALFSLGVFSTGSFLGSECIPLSGFLCQGMTFAHSTTTPSISVVSLGQSTGASWSQAYAAFVPQGTAVDGNGIPNIPQSGVVSLGAVPTGGTAQNVALPDTGP